MANAAAIRQPCEELGETVFPKHSTPRGGNERVVRKVDVFRNGRRLGWQPFRVASPGIAFIRTAFEGSLEPFEERV